MRAPFTNVTSLPHRRLTSIVVAAAFLFTLLLPLLARVSAESDTTPMQLLDLAVSETDIDVSSGSVELDLSGEVFEDQSGFENIEFFYLSPSGDQILEGDANSDEVFIDETIEFPQYAEPGVWRPTFTLIDQAFNTAVLGPDDLVGLGFDVDITITSSPADTTVPTVTNVVIGETTIDTSLPGATVPVSVFATDDLSGIDLSNSSISFVSPSGQRAGSILASAGGNEYSSTIPFDQYAEAGTWTIELFLSDFVTNIGFYDATDLGGLSLPFSVGVTGNPDTTPVSIDRFEFSAANPPTGPGTGGAEVTLGADFSDNLSGVGNVTLTYRSQSTTQFVQATQFFNGTDYQYTVNFSEFAATGVWLPEAFTEDLAGNQESLSHTDLVGLGYDLSLNFIANESENVGGGGSVTTDTGGDGANPADPFEATVTTPVAGDVSIAQVDLTNPVSSNDFLVYDQQYDISAPSATPEAPLVIDFTVDAGSLQGQTAQTIVIFRNGVLVEECTHPTDAIPDPCVSNRVTLGDGDAQLTVRTSEASIWVLGYEEATEPTYSFKRFKKPVKNPPKMNHIDEDQRAIKVKFRLNGESSRLDVLGEEIASSQRIDCTTREAIGDASPIRTTKNGGLKIKDNGVYKFKWKTLRKWEDTCRQLILEFDNGETVYAYFEFDD